MRKWAKCYRQIEIVCSCFIGQHIVVYKVIRKSRFNNRTVVTTHIYVEIDMDMKRKMLEKAEAPRTKKQVPWQKPDILQWLDKLTRESELCAVNYCQTHGMTGGTIMKTLNST